ncbi:MAG: zinc ribbon domain-containing protein [Spirochaetales bacterium]
MEQIKCPNCGSTIDKKSLKCKYCGTELLDNSAPKLQSLGLKTDMTDEEIVGQIQSMEEMAKVGGNIISTIFLMLFCIGLIVAGILQMLNFANVSFNIETIVAIIFIVGGTIGLVAIVKNKLKNNKNKL